MNRIRSSDIKGLNDTPKAVEMLSNAAQMYTESHYKRLAIGKRC